MSERSHFGQVESIEHGTIRGWAVDTTQPGRGASLFLFIDGAPVANFICDQQRGDLAAAGLPRDDTGFLVPVPTQFLDGAPHLFAIRLANGAYLDIGTPETGIGQSATFTMAASDPAASGSSPAAPAVATLISFVDTVANNALRGWAARSTPGDPLRRGGLDLSIRCNGVEVGITKADKYRPDVGKAVDCDDYCGFEYVPPPRFRDGAPYNFHITLASTGEDLSNSPVVYQHPAHMPETQLAALANAVDQMSIQLWHVKRELAGLMGGQVLTLDDYDGWAGRYQTALRRRVPSPPEADRGPLVTILCPVYRPRMEDFRAAIASVQAQTYRNWELILVDDCSGKRDLTAFMTKAAAADKRIRLITLAKNVGISDATNVAIAAAAGDYIALFDHDDLLVDVAVATMVGVARQTGAKLLYSDEDKVDDYGRFSDPHFKGAWNYRLLIGQNYVCHFLMVEAATLRKAGPLRKKYDGAQDHDLMLRLAELLDPAEIVHVAEILYHWRKTPGSTATKISAKSYAVKAGALAIQDHLKRRGMAVRAKPMLGVTIYDIDWRFTAEPGVTVIIPFREQVEMTERCIEALLSKTKYGAFDIVLVDNWSSSAEAAAFCARMAKTDRVRVLRVEEPFNYARINNLAAATTKAELLVFLNNDVIVETADWLRRMVDEALADPAVAAVGVKLVYPDRTVQHAGVILGVGGVGDHAYRRRPVDDPFYVGRGVCAQELSAVTAAMMLCRAAAFHEAGGFDEAELAVAYNDVDLCLKFRKAGHAVILRPSVVAVHHESISRGNDMDHARLGRFVYEERVMLSRWSGVLASDPYYNPNFSPEGRIFDALSTKPLSPLSDEPIRFRAGSARIPVPHDRSRTTGKE